MKKRIYGKKLGRSTTARRALFRSLTRSLVLHGSIKTTKAKAMFLKRQVDSLVKYAKKDDVASRRRIYAKLANDRLLTDLIVKKVARSISRRNGGFTRVISLPVRRGDKAEMARIEWVEEIKKDVTKQKEKSTGRSGSGKRTQSSRPQKTLKKTSTKIQKAHSTKK